MTSGLFNMPGWSESNSVMASVGSPQRRPQQLRRFHRTVCLPFLKCGSIAAPTGLFVPIFGIAEARR
jgi:hypothetical protein